MNYQELAPDKAYRLINHGPCVFLTSRSGKKENVMTCAWITPVNTDPPLVAVCISNESYTYRLITEDRHFTVSVPETGFLKALKKAGSVSGYRIKDKFSFCGLNKRYPPFKNNGKITPPGINGCLGNIYCRLLRKTRFSDVDLLVGKVIYSEVLSGCLTDKSILDLEKKKTLHHLGGNVFAVPAPMNIQ